MENKYQKTVAVNFRLTLPERQALELITLREGRSTLTETMRELMREGIERRLPNPIGLVALLKDNDEADTNE